MSQTLQEWKCRHGDNLFVTMSDESMMDAIQDYHAKYESSSTGMRVPVKEGGHEEVYWLNVEVEGHGMFISRIYRRKIYRAGGVKSPYKKPKTIEDVARELDWKHNPSELLEPWDGEGPWE